MSEIAKRADAPVTGATFEASGVYRLLTVALGEVPARQAFAQLDVVAALLRPVGETVSRAELAQALNMALFLDVTRRVPMASAYVADLQRAGERLVFDHGALRTVAWPSGEFGAMGLEGAVRLGYAKELAAVEDAGERERLFRKMVDKAYQNGKAINMASFLEIDAVIDPEQTRAWLLRGLNATAPSAAPEGRKRSFVDTW